MKNLFNGGYKGTKVLVTGHTGFKGSWLVHWLNCLGADVVGLSLDPITEPNHWELLGIKIQEYHVDIREPKTIEEIMTREKPEMVFHLAAQPLVRQSYTEPTETWSSNMTGTLNLLEACRQVISIKALVVVTTDKVYEEQERPNGYSETDSLGGHDPYSASKAACEIAVDSYRKSFFEPNGGPLTATARAGNVIGGGDWSADRLIPDIIRSIEGGEALCIRSPEAIRPWQHVLDCLSGYLLLGAHLLEGKKGYARAWNFGPDQTDNSTVSSILDLFGSYCSGIHWKDVSGEEHLHEASRLLLDSTQARRSMGWRPVWTLEKAVIHTASWYQSFMRGGEIRTDEQLNQYIQDAVDAELPWAKN